MCMTKVTVCILDKLRRILCMSPLDYVHVKVLNFSQPTMKAEKNTEYLLEIKWSWCYGTKTTLTLDSVNKHKKEVKNKSLKKNVDT